MFFLLVSLCSGGFYNEKKEKDVSSYYTYFILRVLFIWKLSVFCTEFKNGRACAIQMLQKHCNPGGRLFVEPCRTPYRLRIWNSCERIHQRIETDQSAGIWNHTNRRTFDHPVLHNRISTIICFYIIQISFTPHVIDINSLQKGMLSGR